MKFSPTKNRSDARMKVWWCCFKKIQSSVILHSQIIETGFRASIFASVNCMRANIDIAQK